MPDNVTMQVQILLPFQIFTTLENVVSLVVATPSGALGILPHRLDCVTPLEAGILSYRLASAPQTRYVALDVGVLVKTAQQVHISVRNALAGDHLTDLANAVHDDFLQLDETERAMRSALAKLESGFVRRFTGLQR